MIFLIEILFIVQIARTKMSLFLSDKLMIRLQLLEIWRLSLEEGKDDCACASYPPRVKSWQHSQYPVWRSEELYEESHILFFSLI